MYSAGDMCSTVQVLEEAKSMGLPGAEVTESCKLLAVAAVCVWGGEVR